MNVPFRSYNMNFPELCETGFVDCIVNVQEDYIYEAFAETGTAVTESKWAVRRTDTTTGSVEWAGGTNNQIYAANDLPSLFA